MATKQTAQLKTEPQINADATTAVVGAQDESGAAVVAQQSGPVKFVPKIKRILTLPLLKMKEGTPIYVKFTDGPLFVGKQIANPDPTKPPQEPPIMANVTNLETGEMVQIMAGKVLQGILGDDYPDNGYVGKAFSITLVEKKRGKGAGTYNTYSVAEIEA